MNADSIYLIGQNHLVNEDYALANVEANLVYAIVCDGCSSSPDVDIGARVMALSAKRNLLLNPDVSPENFGSNTILIAQRIFDIFPRLHPQTLDATLLIATVKDKKLVVLMFGDGMLIHRTNDRTRFVHIELTSGAPDYLSYLLDMNRMKSYKNIDKNYKNICCGMDGKMDSILNGIPLTPYVYQTNVKEGDIISIVSDGINSFRKIDNTPVHWQDLIEEFTGFKNFEGQFVQRRIAAFKRKCLKEGIVHTDDISIASIIV